MQDSRRWTTSAAAGVLPAQSGHGMPQCFCAVARYRVASVAPNTSPHCCFNFAGCDLVGVDAAPRSTDARSTQTRGRCSLLETTTPKQRERQSQRGGAQVCVSECLQRRLAASSSNLQDLGQTIYRPDSGRQHQPQLPLASAASPTPAASGRFGRPSVQATRSDLA